MGSGCSKIYAEKAKAHPDDEIGNVISVPGGCQPIGSTYLNGYIPDNKEYEWAGEGAVCYYCSFSPPNSIDCSSGCDGVNCCAIVGRRGTYKRKSYNADPMACCITGESMIDGLTCHPSYRKTTSDACYRYLKAYCSVGNTLMFDEACQSWCAVNPAECALKKSKLCSEDFSNPNCKEWCLQNPGLCDKSAEEYCAKPENKNDTFCACINSELVKHNYNPLCEDKKCITHGYPTESMITSRGDGCKIIDCTTYLNLSSGGKTELNDVTVQQRCGGDSGVGEPISSSSGSYYPWIIIMIIIIIVVIVVIVVMYVKKWKKS